MNKAIIVGRLAGEPELRQTGNGISVTSFTVAVDRRISREEHQTDWIDCVAWKNTAEFICKYFQKGTPIIIEGSIQTRNWEDKEGNKRKAVEIQVEKVMFVLREKSTTAPQNTVSINEGNSSSPEYKEASGAAQAFSQGSNEDFEQVDDEDLPF